MSDPHPDCLVVKKRKWLQKICLKIRDVYEYCRIRLALYKERPVVFGLKPRLAKLVDGTYCYCMLDCLLPYLRQRYAILSWDRELPRSDVSDMSCVFTPPIKRLKKKVKKTQMWREVLCEIQSEANLIQGIIYDVFKVEVSSDLIKRQLTEVYLIHEGVRPYFRRLLTKWRTKCVVLSVHYSVLNMCLASAAHDLGLPVVELQHGEVNSSHPAYNVPVKKNEYLPDYFLSWGSFWRKFLSNFPQKAVIDAGYPYFDYHIQTYPRKKISDENIHVWFLSQGTIGVELSRLAIELSELLPRDRITLHYKLHPSESKSWTLNYPWLKDSYIDVVSNEESNIYKCLQAADIAIGVNSTAIIEAFAWGVRPLVLSFISGGETLSAFADAGYVEFIHSKEELVNMLKTCKKEWMSEVDVKALWQSNASANIAAFIGKLVRGDYE